MQHLVLAGFIALALAGFSGLVGRPWSGSGELMRLDGIAAGRLADIRESGRLCGG